MALVKREGSKYWYAQFQIAHTRFIRSTRTTDRRTAEKVEANLRALAHAEAFIGKPRRPITLDEALTRHIETKDGASDYRNLISIRNGILRVLSGRTVLAKITADDMEHYRTAQTKRGRSPQTIKHGFRLITASIKTARRGGFETPDLELPVIRLNRSKLRYLSMDEERRLLEELDPSRRRRGLANADAKDGRHRMLTDNMHLVILLLDTGARYSEIAGLQWNQVDLKGASIRLWRPKVENESILFMTARVARILSERAAEGAKQFVFENPDGTKRGYRVAAIGRAFARAGLEDCSIHTLRHTHASRLIQRGMSVYEVRSILGHSDIRTTMRYAHLEQQAVSRRARDVIDALVIE